MIREDLNFFLAYDPKEQNLNVAKLQLKMFILIAWYSDR